MKDIIHSCRNCPFRTLACHSSCEQYKQEKAKWEETKAAMKKERVKWNSLANRFWYKR